jgi:transcriptional regulator with XRE-family HTH domain
MADASVRLRLVGAALRRHRERLGLSIRDVASAMECDPSKISRQETGHRGVWRHELRELLDEYGINDEERHTLLRVADRRASQGWWDHYADVAPACSADYLMLETIAREIASYDSQRIPDLLQTQDYTWALAEAGPSPADPRRRKKLADMQRERQRAAMGGNQAPLDIIVGEGALRAVVGGNQVMHAQLLWLAEVQTACPWVSVRVLPFASGAYSSTGCGHIVILRLAGAADLGVVHLDGVSGGVCLVDAADLAMHAEAFSYAKTFALNEQESLQLILDLSEGCR